MKEGKQAAMFTLPLDPAKADPEQAQAIVDGLYQPWRNGTAEVTGGED